MGTLVISLPDCLAAFVDEQVSQRGYSTRSEYVCALIERDMDRRKLRGQLLDGASSAPATAAGRAYFASLREHVRRAEKGEGER